VRNVIAYLGMIRGELAIAAHLQDQNLDLQLDALNKAG